MVSRFWKRSHRLRSRAETDRKNNRKKHVSIFYKPLMSEKTKHDKYASTMTAGQYLQNSESRSRHQKLLASRSGSPSVPILKDGNNQQLSSKYASTTSHCSSLL